MDNHAVITIDGDFFEYYLALLKDLYALCRKQFFTLEDAAKVRVRGKNSFDKIFFGEEEHNPFFGPGPFSATFSF